MVVGWAGNDVYGEGGYRGVRWIHRSEYNRSEADREVTANWCDRQKSWVIQYCNDFGELKRNDSRILDIIVVGNADGDFFALPKAYNETLSTHIRHLREDHNIQTIDTTIMVAKTVRYDKLHIEDEPINRRLVVSFLRAVVDLRLNYLRLIGADDHLRRRPRIEDLGELKDYPNLTALRIAFQQEFNSNVSSPTKDIPRMPDLETKMAEVDNEIPQWVEMAQEEAILSADREVEPITKDIAEEEQVLEPLKADQADEVVKIKAITVDD